MVARASNSLVEQLVLGRTRVHAVQDLREAQLQLFLLRATRDAALADVMLRHRQYVKVAVSVGRCVGGNARPWVVAAFASELGPADLL